jgi:hypothetical protein
MPPTDYPVITDSGKYQAVAAGQSATPLSGGGGGAVGDYLAGVLIVPASTSPGAVSITDGSGSAITIFSGGTSSVTSLVSFFVPIGAYSASGPWKVTTGASVSVFAVGLFT